MADDGELDRAARWLEKLTRDPLADAVAGRVQVRSASAPRPRGRYQECALELDVAADGIPAGTVIAHRAVFSRDRWPREGDVLPAQISRSRPELVEIDWERLTPR